MMARAVVMVAMLLGTAAASLGPLRDVQAAGGKAGPASPDFDADGYADLAIGAPYSNVRSHASGALHVVYGSPDGLRPGRWEVWTQASPGIVDRPQISDQLGWSIATGDFDGDGHDDLATGARWESRPGAWHSGAVHVIYGSPAGLTAAGSQRWTQNSPGVVDQAERADHFGTALVAADFDGDERDDLAIGTPMENRGSVDAGIVHVLYGTPTGLSGARSQVWSQNSPGIADRAEHDDQFGRALGAGDIDGDGRAELAIGAPHEDRRVFRVGLVHVLRGTRRGLTAQRSQVWHQDSPGILDRAELRDQFGQSLAIADFDGDGHGDLAVGAWWEDFRSALSNEGSFHVIYGSRQGLTARRDQFWHQDRPGVRDRRHSSDNFGQALGTGDFDGDGHDDLAVGIPSADLRPDLNSNRGALHLFFGSPRGLTARRDRYITQDSPGVADRSERYDRFGTAVAAADHDGDGYDDLTVGIAWEDVRARDDGAVYVMYGSPSGPRVARDRFLSPRGSGLSPAARRGGRFGWTISGSGKHSGTTTVNDPRN